MARNKEGQFIQEPNFDIKFWQDRELDQELREWQVKTFFSKPAGFSDNQKIEILKILRSPKMTGQS